MVTNRRFSLEHFINSLNVVPAHAEAHPVLHAFFNQEQQLRALRHLPAVLEWNKLSLSRLNNKLDRERARELTFADLLNEIPDQVFLRYFSPDKPVEVIVLMIGRHRRNPAGKKHSTDS